MSADWTIRNWQSDNGTNSGGPWASGEGRAWPRCRSRSRSQGSRGRRWQSDSTSAVSYSGLYAQYESNQGQTATGSTVAAFDNSLHHTADSEIAALKVELATAESRCKAEKDYVEDLATQFGMEHDRVKQLTQQLQQAQSEVQLAKQECHECQNRLQAQHRGSFLQKRDMTSQVNSLQLQVEQVTSECIGYKNALAESQASLEACRRQNECYLREVDAKEGMLRRLCAENVRLKSSMELIHQTHSEMNGLVAQLSMVVQQMQSYQTRAKDAIAAEQQDRTNSDQTSARTIM